MLADKIVLVTGAAMRIGGASAQVFAREGASSILVDILQDRGEEIAQFV